MYYREQEHASNSVQNTRLNTLIDGTLSQLGQWLQNPWRRFSLILISLLLGAFLASAIATTAGQKAELDVVVAAILVALLEVVSWLVYGSDRRRQSVSPGSTQRALLLDMAQALKIGLIYGLFLEAFKLGS